MNQWEKVTTTKNQNIENQKEHQKNFKASEHQKCLFSSSLLRHHYIKIDKDHTMKVVDRYYKNQNIEKNEKNIKSLSFV